jgi:hypothetical protein
VYQHYFIATFEQCYFEDQCACLQSGQYTLLLVDNKMLIDRSVSSRPLVRTFGVETEKFHQSGAATNSLDPEVKAVIDQILKLNLVQVNQMVTQLKVH